MKELDITAEKNRYHAAIKRIARRYGVRKLAADYEIPLGTLYAILYNPKRCKLETMAKAYELSKSA